MSVPRPYFAAFFALSAVACAPVILLPGDHEGAGGSGTGAASGIGAGAGTSTGGSTGSVFDGCEVECSVPPAAGTCACALHCPPEVPPTRKVSCTPIVDVTGNPMVRCVCTVDEQFSGVCYEDHEELLCSFEKGCCANYFSGK